MPSTNGKLSLVMLSGGIDSAVALYWAMKKGYKIETITFNYFLRSKGEILAARSLAKLNRFYQHEIDLEFLKEIEDSRIKRNPLLKNAESAYIPSRNVIFYGIASFLAEPLDAKYVVGGHNKDDVKDFPDASLEFFKFFNKTTALGLYSGNRTGRVVLPLAKLSKKQVIQLGAKLHVPFELTWSCYRSSKKPCGICHSCKLRSKSFHDAGVLDPLA